MGRRKLDKLWAEQNHEFIKPISYVGGLNIIISDNTLMNVKGNKI